MTYVNSVKWVASAFKFKIKKKKQLFSTYTSHDFSLAIVF